MLKPFIKAALAGKHLDPAASEEAMRIVMNGQSNAVQIAAWLVALRQKGETAEEAVGFARAMRAAMVALDDVPDGAIDTCGTGGDGLSTFNISTAAALVAAACGVPVAKHGNRAVSSRAGSADVLAALGFDIDPGAGVVRRSLSATRFAFLFAPRFHPAMRHAVEPRREIGVRTVFNILGPLCNPARVTRQVVGVYDPAWRRLLAEALGALGAERAVVVCGPGGADEFLPCGHNEVAEWDGATVREYRVHPDDVGVLVCRIDDLVGGDADQNARIIRGIARGERGPRSETAVFNAGAALYVAGRTESISDGVTVARAAIADGLVNDTLERAVSASQPSGEKES